MNWFCFSLSLGCLVFAACFLVLAQIKETNAKNEQIKAREATRRLYEEADRQQKRLDATKRKVIEYVEACARGENVELEL